MKAPEPTLSGNIRTREELECLDPCPEQMEVEQPVTAMEADLQQSTKRQRVVSEVTASDVGILPGMLAHIDNCFLSSPIPLENIQSVSSYMHDLGSMENGSGKKGDCQKPSSMGVNTRWSVSNTTFVDGGGVHLLSWNLFEFSKANGPGVTHPITT